MKVERRLKARSNLFHIQFFSNSSSTSREKKKRKSRFRDFEGKSKTLKSSIEITSYTIFLILLLRVERKRRGTVEISRENRGERGYLKMKVERRLKARSNLFHIQSF